MVYKLGLKKRNCCYKSNLGHADKKDWIFHISYKNFYHLKDKNYIQGLEETNLKRRVALSSLYKLVYVFYCVHFYILLLTL